MTVTASTEWLDREQILGGLSDLVRALVVSMQIVRETGSTQADALALPAPSQGCAVFLAERQHAGQGRRGRAWNSPMAANLYLSLSRRFVLTPAALSGLSLVVGVLIVEALHGLGYRAITLKWPNDLIHANRKLGGILINLQSLEDKASTGVVIGIGINVAMPVEAGAEIDQPWCDLAGTGSGEPPGRNDLAATLLTRLLPGLDEFASGGLAPWLPRFDAMDGLRGKNVRIVEGALTHDGQYLGISDSGALRVRLGDAEREFHGGQVSVRAA